MTQAIMLQGTASDVGKSVLVAGLCRIFYQDGLRTAPFKSQNMALNSGITPDGKEMGRAQIFQAEAAGIVPDVRWSTACVNVKAWRRWIPRSTTRGINRSSSIFWPTQRANILILSKIYHIMQQHQEPSC